MFYVFFLKFAVILNTNFSKIGKLKLQSTIQNNPILLKEFTRVKALAFLPPDEIVNAYEELPKSDEMQPFHNYFRKTYVMGNNNRPPLYLTKWWSAIDMLLEDLPTTTNNAEAYHSQLSSNSRGRHLTMNEYISRLKDQARSSVGKLIQADQGRPWPNNRKKETVQRIKRLKAIVQRKTENGFNSNIEYLDAIAYNVN